MHILVTGGTGFIGKFTVRALRAAGHDVRVLVRDRARALSVLGPDVDLAVGGALDGRAVRTALVGCDALIHAAAVYSYDRRHASHNFVHVVDVHRYWFTFAEPGSACVHDCNSRLMLLNRALDIGTPDAVSDDVERAENEAGYRNESHGTHRLLLHFSAVRRPDWRGADSAR